MKKSKKISGGKLRPHQQAVIDVLKSGKKLRLEIPRNAGKTRPQLNPRITKLAKTSKQMAKAGLPTGMDQQVKDVEAFPADTAVKEGTRLSVHKATLSEQLPCGVYFDTARHTAIVHKVGRSNVEFVTMRNGTIEHETMNAVQFTRLFHGRWPAYPLRRAARLYIDSSLSKSHSAERTLRTLLAK